MSHFSSKNSRERIYWDGKFIGCKDTVDSKAKKIITIYQKQFDSTMRPLISSYPESYILPPIICTDEIVYERPSGYPCTTVGKTKYYYFDTTKSHICIKKNFDEIERKLKKVSSMSYGGLQPCIRYETRKEEGWRERVFPQGDFEIISHITNQSDQNLIESNVLIALVESLRLHGFKDNQIIIRINNKEGIFHKMWRDVKLFDVNNDKFLKGMNDLEKDNLDGKNISKQLKKETTFWNKIKDSFSKTEQEIINKILVGGSYDLPLLKINYPGIVNEIERMNEIISIVKKSVGNDVTIYIDPRSIKPGTYRGITIQADMKIKGKYYPEVCGGGCDFSFFPQYYISGFALGLMRLSTLQKLL